MEQNHLRNFGLVVQDEMLFKEKVMHVRQTHGAQQMKTDHNSSH